MVTTRPPWHRTSGGRRQVKSAATHVPCDSVPSSTRVVGGNAVVAKSYQVAILGVHFCRPPTPYCQCVRAGNSLALTHDQMKVELGRKIRRKFHKTIGRKKEASVATLGGNNACSPEALALIRQVAIAVTITTTTAAAVTTAIAGAPDMPSPYWNNPCTRREDPQD
ncbi:hypothetical protein ACA910_012358 [Epithemia clementina (nom. ined.)]